MSPFRTLSPRSSVKIRYAITIPAVAAMAAIAGAAGVWTTATAAHPPAIASRVVVAGHVSTQAAQVAPPAVAATHVQLDALVTSATAGRQTPAPTPRQIALSLLRRFGWSSRQFPPLNRLWSRESGWNVHAANVYSGAYGIPQAVPGIKMAAAGPNWRTSARTQILWGLRYIKGRYGSPAAAWAHELATGWY